MDDFEKLEVDLYKQDSKLAELCFKDELQEYKKIGDMKYLMMQLRTMAKAFSWTNLEKKTGLRRSTLYSILEGKKEPKLSSFIKIIGAFGFSISFKKTRKLPVQNKF